MGRPKGSKNKPKENTEERYEGFFLIDSGIKLHVNVSADYIDEEAFAELADARWPYEINDTIWLGPEDNIFLRADRVIGWCIWVEEIKPDPSED